MSWSGFYGDFYSALSVKSTPQQIQDLLNSMVADNPNDELHIEFAAVALCAMKAYGYKVYDDQSSTLILDNLKQSYSSVNWTLMSKIIQASIANDFLINIDDEMLKSITQKENGFLVDIDGVYSSQYHSYILLLLALFGQGNEVKSVVEKGFMWCEEQFQRLGDTNATGRGRFQKFGYVSMIGAHYFAFQKWGIGVSDSFLQATMNKLHNASANTSALSYFWESPVRNKILHKYNTKNDYNGFSDFWLRFVQDVLKVELQFPLPEYTHNIKVYKFDGTFVFFDDESQIACIDFVQDTHVPFFQTVKSKVYNLLKFKSKPLSDDLIVYDASKNFLCKNNDIEIKFNVLKKGFSVSIKSGLYSECSVWYKPEKISDILLELDGSIDKFNQQIDIYNTKWYGFSLRSVRQSSSFIKFKI